MTVRVPSGCSKATFIAAGQEPRCQEVAAPPGQNLCADAPAQAPPGRAELRGPPWPSFFLRVKKCGLANVAGDTSQNSPMTATATTNNERQISHP